MRSLSRLLFASVHGYIDPASGAACATRDVLELLAARGVDCRAVSTGVLSFRGERAFEPILESLQIPGVAAIDAGDGDALGGWEFQLGGVGVTVIRTRSSRIERSPDPAESRALLRRVELALDRFRPQVLLTYGGHATNLALMAMARRRGVPVVFHLHNFAYGDSSSFVDASATIVPSEYCRRHYARRLGLECAVLPSPIVPERIIAPEREPRFLTFINPEIAKGASIVARIAFELDARRPDIPIMVVEGRGTMKDLAALDLDVSKLRNLRSTPNSIDPRMIYRETRVLLAPSLLRETFGRMASEALANGIPVLASDRGALPETLGDAGFLFTPPDCCTPTSRQTPSARDVAPWLATIEKLWDDPAWDARHRDRALEAARRWEPDLVARRYLDFFESVARKD